MNVSLTQDLADLVRRKVESGLYTSASEVVREALRLLADQDRLNSIREEELRPQIAEGLRRAEEQPLVAGDEVFARLDARLRKLEEERQGE
jgi:antitoxin ParD1/3/4